MTTGYTAPVQSGEITELSDFVIFCARAFTPMILLRDSDASLEATRRYIKDEAYLEAENDYYARSLAESRERLAALKAMTDDEVLAAAREEAEGIVKRNHEGESENLKQRRRYEAMLAKVEQWEPPTPEHVAFKQFMVEQLTSSIKSDCISFASAVPAISLGWRDVEVESLEKRIQSDLDNIKERQERNRTRKLWVEGLVESLAGEG